MDESRAPRLAWGTLLAIAAARLLIQGAGMTHYGYFRDELYYLASTEHLAWGYVEHPPLSIAVLAAVRALLGDSLVALRMVPALAGAATVVLTGVLARTLGGGRFAQGLAALAAALSPVFLGTNHYYSMNSLDLLLWTIAVWLLVRAIDDGGPRHWLWLGVVLGLGLLNKISVLWLGGGIAVGLLLTTHRRVLLTPWPWAAAAIAGVMFLPHVVWQMRNHWPTLDFMRNATAHKMVAVSPLGFVREQVLSMNPGSAPVWIAGLALGLWGLAGSRGRLLAWIYVTVFALLIAGGKSRASYLAVAYPMLLALGGIVFARLAARRGLGWTRVAIALLVAGLGLVAVPMAVPVLPVERFVRYQHALGLAPHTDEHLAMGALPQQYADMFGWEAMAALVDSAYRRLTPEERAHARVFGQNYGEAGAIDVLGRRRGLPRAMSGHNSYWLWGPGDWDGSVLIIIGGDHEDNARYFDQVEIVGQTRDPWAMPYERGLDVSIGRRLRMPFARAWPALKHYI